MKILIVLSFFLSSCLPQNKSSDLKHDVGIPSSSGGNGPQYEIVSRDTFLKNFPVWLKAMGFPDTGYKVLPHRSRAY